LYIGGAAGYSGELFIFTEGSYSKKSIDAFVSDKAYEDMRSVVFDFDADGDQDIYVCSGGNEF